MLPNANDYAGILREVQAVWEYLGESQRNELQLQAEIDAIVDTLARHERRVWVEQTEMDFARIIGIDAKTQ